MAFNLLFFAFTYISLSLICEWQVDKLNLCLNQPRIINHQPRFFFIWNDFFFPCELFCKPLRTERKEETIRNRYDLCIY